MQQTLSAARVTGGEQHREHPEGNVGPRHAHLEEPLGSGVPYGHAQGKPAPVNAILGRIFPSTANGAAAHRSRVLPGILYVEDNAIIRDIYGEILSRAGYKVDFAEDGQAGWESLRRKKYELLITDYDMPQLTGLDLAVRARVGGMALPIIVASGCAWLMNEDVYAWLRLSSCLQKPFTADDFLQTVRAVLFAAPSAHH